MEPSPESVELKLLSQGIYRAGTNDKIIVEVWQDGPGYRFRVPKYSDRSEVGTDCLEWWAAGAACQTEEEAQDQGCKRAGIANDSQVSSKNFSGSGKTRPYPPQ